MANSTESNNSNNVNTNKQVPNQNQSVDSNNNISTVNLNIHDVNLQSQQQQQYINTFTTNFGQNHDTFNNSQPSLAQNNPPSNMSTVNMPMTNVNNDMQSQATRIQQQPLQNVQIS